MPGDEQIETQEDSAVFAPGVIRDVTNESGLRDDSGAVHNLRLRLRRRREQL